jgi:cytochrome c553
MKQFKFILLFIVFLFTIHVFAEENNWIEELDKVTKKNSKIYWVNKDKKNRSISRELSSEVKAGFGVAERVCATCHGIDGIATGAGNSAIVPNLIAQNKDYLVSKLKDYKSGKIKHDQMSMIVKMISDKDIENVAAWYASIDVVVADPRVPTLLESPKIKK